MSIEVSIIIPFYNKIGLLKKALSSINKQSYTNYEVIIVNDNNIIKNLSYLKKIKDRKIKIIFNKKNLGAGLSRNKGIQNARGDYIAFLDSDDTWYKDKLYYQLRFMKKNGYLASHTSYNLVNLNGKIFAKRKAKLMNHSSLMKSCDIGLSTVILKKDILNNKNNFPKLKTKEDYVLWLKLTKKGIVFYPLKKFYTNWANVPSSLSQSIIQKIKDAFLVYHKYQNLNMINSLINTFILSINYLRK